MTLKKYFIICIAIVVNIAAYAQYGLQKKADNLFNKFSFVHASEVYKSLIEKDFNAEYAIRQLADCYAYMRNPDSAAIYYKKAVEQNNVPVEYYYKYSQALRGVKDYETSRIWLKKFKDNGGIIDNNDFLNDADFITTIFNARQQFFVNSVAFNSKFSDFGAYEHGNELYLTSSRDEGVSKKHLYGWDGQPFLDIYVTEKGNNDVNFKSKVKGDINTVYHDGPITISEDGKTMYFSRNNFVKNNLKKDKTGISNLKIYKASYVDSVWTNIEELPFNSDDYSTGHPALNNDGTKLYFASDMPGGIGSSDIYYVDINTNGSYSEPKNLGKIVNTNGNELFPFLNSENGLFFSSDGHHGLGLLDIFGTVADKNNDIISVINLGVPVNSSKDDFSFFMTADGTTGYIASNRDGGIGSDDIYSYDRVLPLKAEGTVTDAINDKPIANATVTLLDAGGIKIEELTTDDDGYYEINIDRDADYKLVASHPKYDSYSKVITSKNIDKTTTSIKADIALNPIQDIIKLAELNTIYFDFEKYNIRTDAALELNKIVNMMLNEYPDMIIRIESHTDSRGSMAFNDWLSQERANSTFDYIISQGVDSSRITEYKGYGERQLTNDCDGSYNCTEDQHQLNRRTQFIVIQMK